MKNEIISQILNDFAEIMTEPLESYGELVKSLKSFPQKLTKDEA